MIKRAIALGYIKRQELHGTTESHTVLVQRKPSMALHPLLQNTTFTTLLKRLQNIA